MLCFFEIAQAANSDKNFEQGLAICQDLGFDLKRCSSNGKNLMDAMMAGKLSIRRIKKLEELSVPVFSRHAEGLAKELNRQRN